MKSLFMPGYDFQIYFNMPDMRQETVSITRHYEPGVYISRTYNKPTTSSKRRLGKLMPNIPLSNDSILTWKCYEGVYDWPSPYTGEHVQDCDATLVYIHDLPVLEPAFNWIATQEDVDRSDSYHDDASWCFSRLALASWVSWHVTKRPASELMPPSKRPSFSTCRKRNRPKHKEPSQSIINSIPSSTVPF